MIEKILNKLIALLDKEYVLLSAYLTALKAQTSYVVAGDTVKIHKNVFTLVKFMEKSKELNKLIKECLNETKVYLKLSVDTVTISAIISHLNLQWANKF